MRGKIAAALAFSAVAVRAFGAHAESCYDNNDVAVAKAYWQSASDREQHWIILHDMGIWNIAGATCKLIERGKQVREDEFDIAWRNMKAPTDIAEKIKDAAKGRPNFYRFIAALYFKVVIPSPEAKAAHD